jgi:hypothetical protein
MPALAPIPPVPDVDRYILYTVTVARTNFDVPFPVYGDGADIIVTVNGGDLPSAGFYTFHSKSGTPLDQLPLPITDGEVVINSPVSGQVEITGKFRPRQLSMPTSPSLARREFNQSIGTIISSLREMSKAVDFIRGPLGYLRKGANLFDVQDASAARINIGAANIAGDTFTGPVVMSGATNTRSTIKSTGANFLAGLLLRGRTASADVDWYLDSRGGVDTPNGRLSIFENASERFTILAGGNVGIGANNPAGVL